MATFEAGAIPSSFGNVLFNPMAVDQAVQARQHNALLMDESRQNMARQADTDSREHVAQVAGYILAQPQASRPTAYKAAVEWSRANGHPLPNAPAEYPGDQQMQMLQSMGIPAEQQYKIGMNRQANDAMLPPDGAPAAGGAAPAATPRVAYGAGGPGASLTVPAEYMSYFEEASKRTGIPVERLVAQARQESGFNPGATGAAGEIGLMQIKPSTAAEPGFGMTGIANPATLRDPRTNINFGADYLKARAGGGDMADPAVWHRGLAAYNGGGDPNYVANVTRYLPAPGGGVAARTSGAVDVAGPGAPSMGAPSGGAPAVPTAPGPGQYTPEQMRRLRSMQANGVANQQLREEMDRFDAFNAQTAQHEYQRQKDIETERTKGVPSGYRLVNGKAERIPGLPTDPQELEAQANAGKAVQRQFEQENTLRDEFQKLTADFRIVQTSYENIRHAAKAQDGAGDMSLLYNYVRLLDPTSVVRESEFAAAAASGSLGERVQTAYERIASGARMPDSLRQSFIREGKNLYDTQLKSHNTVADQYETLAKRNGLEPDRVVTRFDRAQDNTATSMAPPAAAVGHLKANPSLSEAFDEKYGAGAAKRALAQ